MKALKAPAGNKRRDVARDGPNVSRDPCHRRNHGRLPTPSACDGSRPSTILAASGSDALTGSPWLPIPEPLALRSNRIS
jgi:hypothetical protein